MDLWRILSRLARGRAWTPEPACGSPDSPTRDAELSAAVTALGAKLARSDGRADAVEFDSFVEAFPPEPRSARDVRRLFALAGGTTLGFEAYARRIGKRYGRCPEILERIIDGLFHVAKSDGVVTDAELAYLEQVSDLMGLPPLSFRRLRYAHLGAPADDPYRLLNVAPDASDEAVRTAWKLALVEHHPDKVAGRGLAAEWIEAAQQRTSAINAAFDAVMRERQALVTAA